jgi:HTH-type transcriptional regulator, sugar sensing transcriptional regulator
MSHDEQTAASLEELGCTAIEAAAYVQLLRVGPSTGYRIAQLLNKAVANTYKALEALERRGLVACEEGEPRAYRALPSAQAGSKFNDDFAKRLERFTVAASALEQHGLDEGVYRLSRSAHVFERARTLIESARSLVLLDARADALELLRPSIEAAIARGLKIVILTYAQIEIAGATIILSHRAPAATQRWPGEPCIINCDGLAALVVRLLHDGDTAGFWTESSYIAWVLYCGLASEIEETRLVRLAQTQPGISLREALATPSDFLLSVTPGDTQKTKR